MKLLVNILCADIDRQMAFYQALFGFAEIESSRSPIYRALDTGASELGFNAPAARELLALPPAPGSASPGVFATFLVAEPDAVDRAAAEVARLGGASLKAPFLTYYGQWQAVLADPEGHAFRVSCLTVPATAGES
jgi:predicted enzyme related to lactoylglutathione lyase